MVAGLAAVWDSLAQALTLSVGGATSLAVSEEDRVAVLQRHDGFYFRVNKNFGPLINNG